MTTQQVLFDRGGGGVSVASFGGRVVWSSTTWMLRHAYMADFKVRAACQHLAFKPTTDFPMPRAR